MGRSHPHSAPAPPPSLLDRGVAIPGIADHVDDSSPGIGRQDVDGMPLREQRLVPPPRLAYPVGVLAFDQLEEPGVGAGAGPEVPRQQIPVDGELGEALVALGDVETPAQVAVLGQVSEPAVEVPPQVRPPGHRQAGVGGEQGVHQARARALDAGYEDRSGGGAHAVSPPRRATRCRRWNMPASRRAGAAAPGRAGASTG